MKYLLLILIPLLIQCEMPFSEAQEEPLYYYIVDSSSNKTNNCTIGGYVNIGNPISVSGNYAFETMATGTGKAVVSGKYITSVIDVNGQVTRWIVKNAPSGQHSYKAIIYWSDGCCFIYEKPWVITVK